MPKRVDHDERRASIAIGVIAVMAEHGIGGVSLRSVAQAAGVSMGRVQHYFDTKSDLVRHACQLFIDRATAEHHGSSQAAQAVRIERLLTMNIPRTADERAGTVIWHEFVIAGGTDARIAEMITRAWRSRREHLVELLGEFPRLSSTELIAEAADHLAASSDGLAVRAMLGDISHRAARTIIATQIAAVTEPLDRRQAK